MDGARGAASWPRMNRKKETGNKHTSEANTDKERTRSKEEGGEI